MLRDGPRRFSLIESLVVDPSIRAPPSIGVPKIAYFYTSGTWVHGDNRSVMRSDNAPLDPPMVRTPVLVDECVLMRDRSSHGVRNLNRPLSTVVFCAESSSARVQCTDARVGCGQCSSRKPGAVKSSGSVSPVARMRLSMSTIWPNVISLQLKRCVLSDLVGSFC